MKIGFFGGTFNPPTIAHIELAKKALIKANLDKVIFVPVGDYYDKKELASGRDRYNMLKTACDELDDIEVSEILLDIKEKIYAIDAFKIIKEKYPNDDIYFIMGADNFVNIMNWKKAEELIYNYKYIVFERKNIDVKEYITRKLNEYKNRIILIKNQKYRDYSSSKFRENKKNKKYIKDIVTTNVLKYIEEKKLYSK